jgi:predicted metalloprotease
MLHGAATGVLMLMGVMGDTKPSLAAEVTGECYVLSPQADNAENWVGPTEVNIGHCAALAMEEILDAPAQDGVGRSRWRDVEIVANTDGSYQVFKEGQLQHQSFWDVEKLVESRVDDIDGFWLREFEARAWKYSTPQRVQAYSRRIRTACGRSVSYNAFYCRASDSIYYDTRLLQDEFSDIGDFAPIVIIAHEWGHSIQAQRSLYRQMRSTGRLERQADCFAGAYVRDASARGVLADTDADEAAELIRNLPRSRTHGTPQQRLASFQNGLEGGVDACLEQSG